MASWRWRAAGGAVLAGATLGVGCSILDDVINFRKCSQAALDAALQRGDFTALVGEPLAVGPWYNASLAVSHQGRSVSATFPVSGPQGTAMLHVRALRTSGSPSTLLYNLFEEGHWTLFALQARVTNHTRAAPLQPPLNSHQVAKQGTPPPEPPSGAPEQSVAEGSHRAVRGDEGSGPGAGDLDSAGVGGGQSQGWKTVQLDLLSPIGMAPLSSSTGAPNTVCLPCEAQASAQRAEQHS